MDICLKEIKESIARFYDFTNKNVIIVGAGGGRLVGYARSAKKIMAVDCSKKAIEELKNVIINDNSQGKYELVNDRFENIDCNGDVVVFEFSLHEFPDVPRAIEHAFDMTKEVIIAEHASDSEWICLADEDHNAKRVEEAIKDWEIKRKDEYCAIKEFEDYDDLKRKLGVDEEQSETHRICEYRGRKEIKIQMKYRIVELGKKPNSAKA